MTLNDYLLSRGLSQVVIDELLPHIDEDGADGIFCDASKIMNQDKYFYWPEQTRFVGVGLCPNGDSVAIDTQKQPGAVFYVAHELVWGRRQSWDEIVVRVADSPADFVSRLLEDEDFPYDYWEAKERIE